MQIRNGFGAVDLAALRKPELFGERGNVVDVGVDGFEPEAHRDHCGMGAPRRTPCVDFPDEDRHVAPAQRHILPAEILDRSASAGNAIT